VTTTSCPYFSVKPEMHIQSEHHAHHSPSILRVLSGINKLKPWIWVAQDYAIVREKSVPTTE